MNGSLVIRMLLARDEMTVQPAERLGNAGWNASHRLDDSDAAPGAAVSSVECEQAAQQLRESKGYPPGFDRVVLECVPFERCGQVRDPTGTIPMPAFPKSLAIRRGFVRRGHPCRARTSEHCPLQDGRGETPVPRRPCISF